MATVTQTPQKLLLAAPRGYCAGVDRAVQTVERALGLYGAPVYVRKEIGHNKHVVEQLPAPAEPYSSTPRRRSPRARRWFSRPTGSPPACTATPSSRGSTRSTPRVH